MTIYKLAQERDQTKLDAYRKTFGSSYTTSYDTSD